MKKQLCLFLALLMAFSFAACGKKEDSDDLKTNDEVKTKENATDASLEEYFNTVEEAEKEEVIFEENGIKITALELEEKGFMGPELSLKIENGSENNIKIEAKDVSVNGFVVGVYFSAEVNSGKEVTEKLTLAGTSLELSGVTEIDTVEFTLFGVNLATEENVFEKAVVMDFMEEEYIQPVNTAGTIMADTGEMKIIVQELRESTGDGAQIIVYAENNTDRALTYTASNVMINGLNVEPIFALGIPAGKKAVGAMSFTQEDFDANAITKVNELACEFKAYDFSVGAYYYESEIVSVTFE